jgi:hypothetical protein
VLGLVPDRVPAERLPGLLEILPTPEEQKKLAAYRTNPVALDEAEVFMLQTMQVTKGLPCG